MDAASKARAAAETIWSLVGDGKGIAELPADLRPTNRAEGYAAQERLMAYSAQPLFGHGAIREGVGSNVLGSPMIALAWLVHELSSLNITLKAGEVVTTGTCFTPFAIAPGESIVVDFGALGRIEARFTD